MEAKQLSGVALGVERSEGNLTGLVEIGENAGCGCLADAALFAVRQEQARLIDGGGMSCLFCGLSQSSSILEKGCTLAGFFPAARAAPGRRNLFRCAGLRSSKA